MQVHRDANETEIVAALVRVGCSVVRVYLADAAGVPDLLVGFRGRTYLLEVKVPGGRLDKRQRQWHAEWRGGPVLVVDGVREALAALDRGRLRGQAPGGGGNRLGAGAAGELAGGALAGARTGLPGCADSRVERVDRRRSGKVRG